MHVTVTSLHMCGGRTVPLCMFMSVDQYIEIMNREFCQLWIPIGRGMDFLNSVWLDVPVSCIASQ